MAKGGKKSEISQCSSIEGLQKALDHTYRLLLETAKEDWQRLFVEPDPSDSCVNVRISKEAIAEELEAIPCAGFIPPRKKPVNGKLRRRPA